MSAKAKIRKQTESDFMKPSFLKTVCKHKILLLMLIPAVAYVIIFSYIPMVGIIMAFKKFNYMDGIFGSPWNGLNNFNFLFQSGRLWSLTRNTLLYNVAFITVGLILQAGFAIIINELLLKRFRKIMQSFMFLPFFISWVVAVAVVQVIFGYDYGIINKFLDFFGAQRLNIYVDPAPWPFLLVFFNAWKGTGYGMIVYLAAIAGIDQEMYEAAEIDGANIWQRIFKVTLPSLIPTIVIMMILAVGGIFRGDFGMFFQLIGNNGALLEIGDILDLYVYRAMASSSNIGMASAAGLYQSILCFIMVMFTNAIVKRVERDYSLF